MTNSYLSVSCDSGREWKVFKSKAAVSSECSQQIDLIRLQGTNLISHPFLSRRPTHPERRKSPYCSSMSALGCYR